MSKSILTNEMLVKLADVVKSFMENGENFSFYDAFCETRDQNDWNIRYSEVRSEIRDAIKEVVDQIGGYASSFYNDEELDCIYLLFYPEESKKHEGCCQCDDCTKCNDCLNESSDLDMTINLNVDSRNRIYLPKDFLEFSKYDDSTIYVNYFEDDNVITLTKYEDYDADVTKVINFNPKGMHVSIGNFLKHTARYSTYSIEAVAHSDMHSFTLKIK